MYVFMYMYIYAHSPPSAPAHQEDSGAIGCFKYMTWIDM